MAVPEWIASQRLDRGLCEQCGQRPYATEWAGNGRADLLGVLPAEAGRRAREAGEMTERIEQVERECSCCVRCETCGTQVNVVEVRGSRCVECEDQR